MTWDLTLPWWQWFLMALAAFALRDGLAKGWERWRGGRGKVTGTVSVSAPVTFFEDLDHALELAEMNLYSREISCCETDDHAQLRAGVARLRRLVEEADYGPIKEEA